MGFVLSIKKFLSNKSFFILFSEWEIQGCWVRTHQIWRKSGSITLDLKSFQKVPPWNVSGFYIAAFIIFGVWESGSLIPCVSWVWPLSRCMWPEIFMQMCSTFWFVISVHSNLHWFDCIVLQVLNEKTKSLHLDNT